MGYTDVDIGIMCDEPADDIEPGQMLGTEGDSYEPYEYSEDDDDDDDF